MDAPEVAVAPAKDRLAFANMMQLYVYDFTELWAGTPRGDLGEDGRFPEYPLDAYWGEEGCIPLSVKVGGCFAGFALLNTTSHSGRPVERNMAEFFIARKHRRDGVGTAAALSIFSRYPGQWEAAVARKNVGALAFWRRVVSQHPGVGDIEELDLATSEWNGPILRFRIKRRA